MRITARLRALWLPALLVLLTALVFAACGPQAPQGGNGGYGTQTQTSQNTGSGQSLQQDPNVQAVQNADQQVQSVIQSLSGSQNDANQDYSSQDTPNVP
jgi:hypothetical protein